MAHLQIRFTPLKRAGLLGYLDDPNFFIVTFLGLCTFILFFFYLRSMLKQLDPSQAIPGRVRSALDTMAEGLLVLDARQNIVLANEAFARLVKEDDARLLGRAISDFHWDRTDEGDFNNDEAPWSLALKDGEPKMSMRIRLYLDEENERYATFMTNCSPVLAAPGKAQGVLISFDDVTELERKEVELQHSKQEAETANKTKSEFLANMSHEIRTPMNAILGFTEVLKRGYGKGANDSRKYLNTISSSGTHLLGLINDILDLSKVEAGKIELDIVDCEPQRLIHEIVEIMGVKANENGIYLDYEPEGDLPRVLQTDQAKLRQILINLVGNALKFTEQGGVTLKTRFDNSAQPAMFMVDVVDTGIGMSDDQASQIFESFVQADNSISRRFGGTGLGLSISKKFAETLGGDIVVKSKPGVGSTFAISLQVEVADDVEMVSADDLVNFEWQEETNAEGHWSFPQARVLVIDDGEENRDLLQLVLSEAELTVETGVNGQEAVDMALARTFDIILMDVQMPVMDGYEAVGRMRESGLTLPVIALTAHAMKGIEDQCLAAGYSGYLPKPIDLDNLLSMLSEELGGTFIEDEPRITSTSSLRSPIRSTLPMKSDRIRELVHKFVPRLGQQLAALERAIDESELAEIASIAHWLKGSAGSVGFNDFTEPSAELEILAKAGRTEGIAEKYAELIELYNRIELDDGTVKDEQSPVDKQVISLNEMINRQDTTPVRSSLPGGNAKLQELVSRFVLRLEEQFENMQTVADAGDFPQLSELAHWMKGSAGSAGFNVFTEPATELEQAANSQTISVVQKKLTQIGDLISRIELEDSRKLADAN